MRVISSKSSKSESTTYEGTNSRGCHRLRKERSSCVKARCARPTAMRARWISVDEAVEPQSRLYYSRRAIWRSRCSGAVSSRATPIRSLSVSANSRVGGSAHDTAPGIIIVDAAKARTAREFDCFPIRVRCPGRKLPAKFFPEVISVIVVSSAAAPQL